MSDIEQICAWAFDAWLDVIRREQRPPFEVVDVLKTHAVAWGRLAVPARIMLERDAEGRFMWQMHPAVEKASAKTWAWLVRVRAGMQRRILETYSEGPILRHYLEMCETVAGFKEFGEVVYGPQVFDLIAFSPDLKKCYGPLSGATVLGWPQEPECADKAVRVFSTIAKWLDGRCGGVVMVGSEVENLDWLRECRHGVICDDIKAGETLQKKLRRPYDGPKVLVAT